MLPRTAAVETRPARGRPRLFANSFRRPREVMVRLTRSTYRRAALTAAAAGLVAAGAMATIPTAQAASTTPADAHTAAALTTQLGSSRTAGSYLDRATGHMVVNITDSSTAGTVRAKGAQ